MIPLAKGVSPGGCLNGSGPSSSEIENGSGRTGRSASTAERATTVCRAQQAKS